jgi:hypothetical protein
VLCLAGAAVAVLAIRKIEHKQPAATPAEVEVAA